MAGHIRRRSGKWQARMPDPSRGGTAKLERTFRTKLEAERWLVSQQAAVHRGDWVDPRSGDRPFFELVEVWRATLVDVGPVTLAGYESILRNHVLPKWGSRKVGSITHHAIQWWVNDLSSQG